MPGLRRQMDVCHRADFGLPCFEPQKPPGLDPELMLLVGVALVVAVLVVELAVVALVSVVLAVRVVLAGVVVRAAPAVVALVEVVVPETVPVPASPPRPVAPVAAGSTMRLEPTKAQLVSARMAIRPGLPPPFLEEVEASTYQGGQAGSVRIEVDHVDLVLPSLIVRPPHASLAKAVASWSY